MMGYPEEAGMKVSLHAHGRVSPKHVGPVPFAITITIVLGAGLSPLLSSKPFVSIPAALMFAVLTSYTVHIQAPLLTSAGALVAVLYLLGPVPIVGLWPMAGLVALLVAMVYSATRGELGAWRSWFRLGRLRSDTWIVFLCLVIFTALVLFAWARLMHGSLPAVYVSAARSVAHGTAAAAGLLFLVINGVIEDAVFFGVILSAALHHLPVRTAILVTSVAFGIAHAAGVPGGLLGMLMAATWSMLLVLLRLRTNGMLATYLAHVAADATIVGMLLPKALQ